MADLTVELKVDTMDVMSAVMMVVLLAGMKVGKMVDYLVVVMAGLMVV
jgi:hypothetical protein